MSERTPVPDGLQPLVLQALEHGGFDGLYLESSSGYAGEGGDAGCACTLADLMPCDAPCMECRPGYLQPLTHAERVEQDLDFRIGPTKHPTADALEALGQQRLFASWDPASPDNPYPTPNAE
ncbi:hypothetical protein [Endozoicomonas sp. 4G]|uniref:hypothetical protein n=1 Tax=Endozoicomonas sp. 4G TaxID=2872754 RepID=UPI002078A060|nr:hypothetical protein [Endozoicomonas sp. 4G]